MAAVFFVPAFIFVLELAFTFVLEFVFAFAFGFTLVLFFDLVAGIFCSLISQHEILTAIVISAFLSGGVTFFRPGFAVKSGPCGPVPAKLALGRAGAKTLSICLQGTCNFGCFGT